MKVIVDELPKDCLYCPCFDDSYGCNFHIDFEEKNRPADCPLQSLTDYTKQVRKEAVKEVLDFIEEHKEWYFEKRDYYGAEYIFFNRSNLEKDILDQIQGETK